MENVVLTIHLIIAVFLIGVVLLQRSEGGALFGSSGGFVSNRGAATALSKVTWGLAGAFIATSLVLTVLAASDQASRSVLEGIPATPPPGPSAPATTGPVAPQAPLPPPPSD